MYLIKRTKTAKVLQAVAPGAAVAEGQPETMAVHYALAVTSRGSVEAWTADRARARPLPPEAAQKTLAFYRGRANAGLLEAVAAEAAPERTAPPLGPTPAEENAALRAELAGAADHARTLEARLERAEAELQRAEGFAQENAALKAELAAREAAAQQEQASRRRPRHGRGHEEPAPPADEQAPGE